MSRFLFSRVAAFAMVAVATAAPLQETVQVQGLECEMCDVAIEAIGAALKGEESKLVGYLGDICSILPADDQAECKTLITQFGPQIIEYLINELETKTNGNDYDVCDAVGLCGTVFKSVSPKDDICTVCKDVLGALDDLLSDPKNQAAIEKQIEAICPSAISELCDELIEDEGGKLLDWLAKELDATKVCTAIDAC